MIEYCDSTVGTRSAAERLLPTTLWELPLTQLSLGHQLADTLAGRGILTVGNALDLATVALREGGALTPNEEAELREALARALADGLRQFESTTASDWPTLRAQLLGPLDDNGRKLLVAAVGLDEPLQPRQALVQLLGATQLDDSLDRIRTTLMQHGTALMRRMEEELEREFAAFDGVLHAPNAAIGSIISIITKNCDDAELGLRLIAFCLPHRCHLHRGFLHGVTSRRFRELLRTLPQLVPQHRLPMPVDNILSRLADRATEVPRGVLIHVLRSELRTAVELDSAEGEVAVPDPRTPAARLIEILTEIGTPTSLTDLVFAYRERFRFASGQRLMRHLAGNSVFLRIGSDLWAMRQWHEQELQDCAELAEQTARRISTAESRQNVLELAQRECDEHTAWLVLDRLNQDPRVRMLGRGEACAADQAQSSVMRRLHFAFRSAAGDVVKNLFIDNQPESQRRLVLRLLDHNRAFVQSDANRVDTLSNYPFNQERMKRLIQLVLEHLKKRTGYAQTEALREIVSATDLGGAWLKADLLADILRRNGPFEVLSPGIVALKDLALPSILRRSARQALRAAGKAVTVCDIVQARQDLVEFAPCLAELLLTDPLVQSPDGKYFVLH